MSSTDRPKCKSCNQKLPPPPPPPLEYSGNISELVLLLLWFVCFVLFAFVMLYGETCDPPRLNLESLSVSVDGNNTRAGRWNVAFSMTDDPKTTLPLVCRSYGNGNVVEFHVSVVYSLLSILSRDRFEKYVTPFKPRNGKIISRNATIYTLLPPPTIVNQGLTTLEFEVGVIAINYRGSFRELHCKNMTVWFSADATQGNIISKGGGGGGPPFDCD